MIVALIIISVLLVVVSFLLIKSLREKSFLNQDNKQLHQQSCEDRRLIDKYRQTCQDLELRMKLNGFNKKIDEAKSIQTVISINKDLYEDKEYKDMIDKTACENLGRIIYENHLYEIYEEYDIKFEEFKLKYRTKIKVE